ncbi:hypothetical protein FGO68_gene2809 [Halteria grandinella]|uniref:Uncharacterized protein n=1 Tax=Halteria grandinella TaxID=5974 RepID=A0A8J8N9K9_HALGN|nr:hypothetical protein FGO68_gene2809 [Halteria grandinella]
MPYCEYLVKQIEDVPLSHLMKEFSEQRLFFQQQIGKFVTELCNRNCSVPQLSEFLIKYLCFLSFVQEKGVQVVVSLWKEQRELVTVSTAIEYFNQQFIIFGGKLRREMAVRSLTLETKTPLKFAKTREWIKKQEQ